MSVPFSILATLLILPWMSTSQMAERKVAPFSGNTAVLAAKSGEESSPKGDSKRGPIKAVEEYEKEKRARMKRHIGKRFMAVRTVHPPEFYESPDNLKKKIALREKEEFLIMDVVQNRSGTMNFYKVKFESGKIGYLGADGSNLEIRIKDDSIMPVTKRVVKKKSPSVSVSKEQVSKAIELVRNHLIPSDPVSEDKRSIERRMIEVRATSFPKLKWQYEAKAIGNNKYRVTQVAEGESDRTIIRTWIVDLSAAKVSPENPAAKQLYRQQVDRKR
jgi:hypothetical protein